MKKNWVYHLFESMLKKTLHNSPKKNWIWLKSFVSNQETALLTATSAQIYKFTELFT